MKRLHRNQLETIGTPSESVGDYRLVHSTPTLKAYRDSNNHLIVGVRGTYDKRDVKTDASLAIGRLKRTQRFKDDKRGDALSKLGGKRLHNVKWVDSGDKDFIDAHRLDNF